METDLSPLPIGDIVKHAELEFAGHIGRWFAGVNLTLCVFGLIANFIVIFMIMLTKDYKKSATHWYVLQLAIADTIFLLTIPFKASQHLNLAWIYPHGLCNVIESILFINYYASIIFLMVMSADRYLAVCHSLSTRLNVLRKEVVYYIISACIWVISICLSIPIMLFSVVEGEEPNCQCKLFFPIDKQKDFDDCVKDAGGIPEFIDECKFILEENQLLCRPKQDNSGSVDSTYIQSFNQSIPDEYSYENYGYNTYNGSDYFSEHSGLGTEPSSNPDGIGLVYEGNCHYFSTPYGWKLYIWLNFIFFFLLPIVIMTICYGLIILRLSKMPSSSSRTDKDRWRITLMCIIFVSTFTCSWILFHSVHIAKIYGIRLSGESCIILSNISTTLAFLNSVLNPYLYSFLGTGCKRKLESLTSIGAVQQIISLKSRGSTFMTTNLRSRSRVSEKNSSQHSQENNPSINYRNSTKLLEAQETSAKE